MRTQGKITHWNSDKGYGFITPSSGAKQVFVHIGAFASRNNPPRIGQLVSFTLSTDRQGRPCAEQVMRAGEKPPAGTRGRNTFSTIARTASALVMVGVLVVYGYSLFRDSSWRSVAPVSPLSTPDQPGLSPFHCDGRTHCWHMTSCAEATYFIQNCPGTRMDGDGDGVPCESQWCR
jgi:cold shock CspA family protein